MEINLHNHLSLPLPQRCQNLSMLFQQVQNIRELQILVTNIIKNIFGDAYSPLGWNLKSLSRTSQPYEFSLVKNFLSTQGPFFKGLYKLLSESSVMFEFPISNFPPSTRSCFEDESFSAYYKRKLHVPLGMSTPLAIMLNPVEFFIFSFVHHLVQSPHLRGQSSHMVTDSAYSVLLEEYLNVFIPVSGTVAVPQTVNQAWSPPPTPSSISATPARKVTLFKSSLVGNLTSPATPSVAQTQQNDAWATEAFIQAIVDIWLDCKTKEFHSQMSLDASTSFSQLDMENIAVPSTDLVRCVRIFIKHMHAFGNAPAPSGLSAIAAIKRSYISLFQKELYVFLHHAVDRWPLDTSFRIVLETWLSYIQPWRYTGRSDAEEREKAVEAKWQFFIAENLLFFTVFFTKILLRFARMELAFPKHALMLFRVAKVFSQKDLGIMIANAENALSHGASPRQRGSPDSELVGIVRHHVVQLEGPGYHHVYMFGPQVTNVVNQVIHAAVQSKLKIEHTQLLRLSEDSESTNQGLIKKLMSYFFTPPVKNGNDLEEYKKACDHLEASVSQLATLFELEVPQLDFEAEGLDRSMSSIGGSPRRMDVPGTSLLLSPRDTSFDRNGTQERRLQGIVPTRRFDLQYRGNPDKAPVTSYEEAFCVKILNGLSDALNSRFGGEMIELYSATGWKGKIARQILAPSTSYLEMKRQGNRKVYEEMELPPRLRLRPFANRGLLVLLVIIFSVFFFFFKWSAPGIFVSTALSFLAYVSVKAALTN